MLRWSKVLAQRWGVLGDLPLVVTVPPPVSDYSRAPTVHLEKEISSAPSMGTPLTRPGELQGDTDTVTVTVFLALSWTARCGTLVR